MNPFRRFDKTNPALQWRVFAATSVKRDAYGNPVGELQPVGMLFAALSPNTGEYEQAHSTGETNTPATIYAPTVQGDAHTVTAGNYLANQATGATYMVDEAPQPWVHPRTGQTVGYSIKVRSIPHL